MQYFPSKRKLIQEINALPSGYSFGWREDFESFRSIIIPAFYPEFGDAIEEKAKKWFLLNIARQKNKTGDCIYLFHHQRPVGVIVLEYRSSEAEILGLAVVPEYQGRRLATHLIRYAVFSAWIRCLPLLTSATTNPIAFDVYIREGFRWQE